MKSMSSADAAKAMQKKANAAKKKAQAQAMKAGYKTEAQDMRMGTVTVKSDAERKARADKYRAKAAARADTVKTMNKPSMKEAYKVQVKGLPAIYMDGASAGSVKQAMRKIVKRPDMIVSVDRATDSAQRQDFRMRASGKVDKATVEMLQNMDEDEARMIIAGMPANTRKGYMKAAGISEEAIDEKKKGLWANIHAKRKRGERPAKPGEKGYPKTLDIGEEEEVDEAMTPAQKAAHAKAVADYKAKGGTIKKLPAGKAQGYHGKSDPASGMRGMLDKKDTKHMAKEDDDTARMYKDNPKMMKQGGPAGYKGLNKAGKKSVNKAMKEDDSLVDRTAKVIEASCGTKKKSK